MAMRGNSRVENVILRANDLIAADCKVEALTALYTALASKKYKSHTVEPLMNLFVTLCADVRDLSLLRDGLSIYRNICQTTNAFAVDKVMMQLLNYTLESALTTVPVDGERTDEKITESIRRLVSRGVLDLLEANTAMTKVPEYSSKSLLNAAMDRPIPNIDFIEKLKFFWSTVKMLLDIIKVNSKLEPTFHKIAEVARLFCVKYSFKREFQKLADTLRYYYISAQRLSPSDIRNNSNLLDINSIESTDRNIDTRLNFVRSSIELKMFREAHLNCSDLLGLLQKKPPSDTQLAHYYEVLSHLFEVRGMFQENTFCLIRLCEVLLKSEASISLFFYTKEELLSRTIYSFISETPKLPRNKITENTPLTDPNSSIYNPSCSRESQLLQLLTTSASLPTPSAMFGHIEGLLTKAETIDYLKKESEVIDLFNLFKPYYISNLQFDRYTFLHENIQQIMKILIKPSTQSISTFLNNIIYKVHTIVSIILSEVYSQISMSDFMRISYGNIDSITIPMKLSLMSNFNRACSEYSIYAKVGEDDVIVFNHNENNYDIDRPTFILKNEGNTNEGPSPILDEELDKINNLLNNDIVNSDIYRDIDRAQRRATSAFVNYLKESDEADKDRLKLRKIEEAKFAESERIRLEEERQRNLQIQKEKSDMLVASAQAKFLLDSIRHQIKVNPRFKSFANIVVLNKRIEDITPMDIEENGAQLYAELIEAESAAFEKEKANILRSRKTDIKRVDYFARSLREKEIKLASKYVDEHKNDYVAECEEIEQATTARLKEDEELMKSRLEIILPMKDEVIDQYNITMNRCITLKQKDLDNMLRKKFIQNVNAKFRDIASKEEADEEARIQREKEEAKAEAVAAARARKAGRYDNTTTSEEENGPTDKFTSAFGKSRGFK